MGPPVHRCSSQDRQTSGTPQEAFSLLAMSAGLGTSVLGGQSSPGQAQVVIDYHLHRLFPASRPALRQAPAKTARILKEG